MTSMTFSGKTLVRVREALELAHAELHNMIATCPDPAMYEEELAEYEAEQEQLNKLMDRIDRKMALQSIAHPEAQS